MDAQFTVENIDCKECRITIHSDPAATWDDGKTGVVDCDIESPNSKTLTLMLRKSEARAIASALMGAAAEL